MAKAYSDPCQKSMMEHFAQNFCVQPLSFSKANIGSNLDVRMGPENVFACDSHTNIYYLDGSQTPIENYDRVWQLRKVS